MQVALCADPPDLVHEAGTSGLFGGLMNAMFDWSTLVFIQRYGCVASVAAASHRDSTVHNNSEVVRDIASGVAFHVVKGLRLWQGILQQVVRLQRGVSLLQTRPGLQ
jgi:hypothetical protein